MEHDTIESLTASLPVSWRRRKAIARELRAHMEDTRLELEREGWSPDLAARESLARIGDPDEIASAFGDVYRPGRRARLGLAVGFAGALLLGVYGGGTLASATSAHPRDHHATVTKVAPQHRSHHGR